MIILIPYNSILKNIQMFICSPQSKLFRKGNLKSIKLFTLHLDKRAVDLPTTKRKY